MSAAQLDSITRNWKPLSGLLCVPHCQEEYDRLVALLDGITDEVGENEGHALASLMDVLGALVESYEDSRVPVLA